jgi:hypothetical protein
MAEWLSHCVRSEGAGTIGTGRDDKINGRFGEAPLHISTEWGICPTQPLCQVYLHSIRILPTFVYRQMGSSKASTSLIFFL